MCLFAILWKVWIERNARIICGRAMSIYLIGDLMHWEFSEKSTNACFLHSFSLLYFDFPFLGFIVLHMHNNFFYLVNKIFFFYLKYFGWFCVWWYLIEQIHGNSVAFKSTFANRTFGYCWEAYSFPLQKVLKFIFRVYIGSCGL